MTSNNGRSPALLYFECEYNRYDYGQVLFDNTIYTVPGHSRLDIAINCLQILSFKCLFS